MLKESKYQKGIITNNMYQNKLFYQVEIFIIIRQFIFSIDISIYERNHFTLIAASGERKLISSNKTTKLFPSQTSWHQ